MSQQPTAGLAEDLMDAASPSQHTLPSKFRVPPVPAAIHRRLKLWARREGLHIRPVDEAGGSGLPDALDIQWGLKGRVSPTAGQRKGKEPEWDDGIEIGGILGRVHLWDTSYLLFFLAPPESAQRYLLPSQESADFPDELPSLTPLGTAEDELRRLYLASMPEAERGKAAAMPHGGASGPSRVDTPPPARGVGEFWTLKDVYALPMQQKAAEDLFGRLRNILRRGQTSSNQASPQARNSQGDATPPRQDINGASKVGPAAAAFVNALNPQNWRLPLQAPMRPPFGSRRTQSTGAASAGSTPVKGAQPEGQAIQSQAENVMASVKATQTLEERRDEGGETKAEPLVKAEAENTEDGPDGKPADDSEEDVALPPTVAAATASQRRDLEAKIVREMCRDFGNGTFFYSYDTDLSRSLQHKQKQLEARSQSKGLLTTLLSEEKRPANSEEDGSQPGSKPNETPDAGSAWVEPDQHLPLWRRFDPRFLWNAALLKDFLDIGLHEWVLPIMQGWVQSTRFYIPPTPADQEAYRARTPTMRSSLDSAMLPPNTPVDLVVISRRSKDRAGLRFQRRGIDGAGNVANFVETEQIIRIKAEDRWNVFSFVLIRGSIPLFWSQTSTLTAMKPPPVLDRSIADALPATRQHFDDLQKRYGPQTIVNLAETSGKEGAVTSAFKEAIHELQDENVEYREFDFHHECQGMHYENISKLINELENHFSQQGYYWTCQGEPMREQGSTFRVNCIDCLDRTAVVQSAFARHVLDSQMTQVGIVPDSLDNSMRMIFNDVWANNGDAISRAYAGTSALKGDFTRTGKRDLTGMMHDGLNSMARMYSGAVSDFFAQAVISFMVGERSKAVFSEMMESLQSSDTSDVLRLARARTAAIETSSARVLDVGETLQDAMVMLTPSAAKMEERVLLLSNAAIYLVEYHWTLEKVVQSTRVPLSSVTSLKYGAYITRPVTDAGRDPAENAGLLLTFEREQADTKATNYSILNDVDPAPSNDPPLNDADSTSDEEDAFIQPDSGRKGDAEESTFAAKAIPMEGAGTGSKADLGGVPREQTCQEAVSDFVLAIQRAMARLGLPNVARAEDVVSLADAQKHISLGARADYAIKKLLWLP